MKFVAIIIKPLIFGFKAGIVTVYIVLSLAGYKCLCKWALEVVISYMTIAIYVTKFWKITHMGAPETIRNFEFSMALLTAETTFKNIVLIILGINDLLQSYMGRNSMLNAAFKS